MAHILRSASALDDLQEIWDYIAHDNQGAADALIRDFDRKFRLLSSSPLIGRSAEFLARNLRVCPLGSYLIFYKPSPDGIVVVRVIQGARDVLPNFFESEAA